MSSKWELDDGIESIKSAWQREHTARAILEKSLENIGAENARLRERVDELEALEDGTRYIRQEWYQLAMTENAKLRELVRDMYEDQCIDGDQWKYRDRMRELGVEVDG